MKKNYLKSNSIKYSHINYGFFTRQGGYSENNYESLNCSFSHGDDSRLVNKNIQFAMNQLLLKNKRLKTSKQIHSNLIKEVNKNNFDISVVADGLLTNDSSIAIGVLTADCAPILIFDKSKKFICCLHAGWKGSLNNIAKNSMKLIRKYNNNLDEIIVIIGPCLARNNFEVSCNFKDMFFEKNSKYLNFFLKKNRNKDFFNMRGLLNFQFKELGILNIFNIYEDTYQNNLLFFSHRRSLHNNQKFTGRMVNIISFR